MISVAEAKEKILQNVTSLPAAKMHLSQVQGMVLAEDIYSTINIPAFDQSSMDGYAFSFDDWKANKSLILKGEMAAGSNDTTSVSAGNAIRIFTGAPVPRGADTVVMQEKTRTQNGSLFIDDNTLTRGLNVRIKGSEIKTGEFALAKDTLLTPAAIGFLAALGIIDVPIYPYPSVSIIVTGNELQTPGQPLLQGQVYESNSFSLLAALKQLQITKIKVEKAEDTLEKVKQVLKDALKQSDIVFLTGGVSVGDYDFVAAGAAENGVEKIFHKVKQRPGKPLYFGKKTIGVDSLEQKDKLVFGLPGNPASVLTCFYEYVEPALRKMIRQETGMKIMQAPLAKPFKKTAGLTHFLKGFYDQETVVALHAQESYRLSSFANANCLIKIDEDKTVCEKGELVEIHLLPF